MTAKSKAKTVAVFGATGTAGMSVAHALVQSEHNGIAVARDAARTNLHKRIKVIEAHATDPASVRRFFKITSCDTVISCLASRTGAPDDAWAIDYQANLNVLEAAKAAGVKHFIIISAICVQKPKLEFQRAKLAFEAALIDSGLTYSIIRPTAFFKSLSGQIKRVQNGKPFLVFGDGKLTACKPISDNDLGRFTLTCVDDRTRQNATLPIGGPGPAITPMDQVAMLSELMGCKVKVRHVPLWFMGTIIAVLSTAGLLSKRAKDKAQLAKIGLYYATESMLVWDNNALRYNADATLEFGEETLKAHYAAVIEGHAHSELGAHSVF